jgi:spore coat protein U-like protein
MISIAGKIFCMLLILTVLAGTCYAVPSTVNVSAVILSKSNCKFNTKSAALDFGSLDPVAAPDVTRQATLTFTCNGSASQATYLITDDDGQHETGPNGSRMQHGTVPSAYLPYSFSLNPSSGTVPKGVAQTLTITGTVLGKDYRMAIAGTYADVVTLTINP